MDKEQLRELEVLFPTKEFSLTEKHSIQVKPLSLEDLPKVAEAFSMVASMVGEKKTLPEITVACMSEILKMAKYCIDVPTRLVPIGKVPDLLTMIVELNMSEDIVKKWMALIELVNKELGQGEEKKEQPSPK